MSTLYNTPDHDINITFLDTEPKLELLANLDLEKKRGIIKGGPKSRKQGVDPVELSPSSDLELRKRGIVKRGPKSKKQGWNESTKEKMKKEVIKQYKKEYEELFEHCRECHKTFKDSKDKIKVYPQANSKKYKLVCEKCYDNTIKPDFEEKYQKLLTKIRDLSIQERYGFQVDSRGHAILNKEKTV